MIRLVHDEMLLLCVNQSNNQKSYNQMSTQTTIDVRRHVKSTLNHRYNSVSGLNKYDNKTGQDSGVK
jgi:NRPS condensation-like uncharacterized protein